MKKTSTFSLVILSVVIALLANILFGRFLSAKISTLPLVNKWKILSPQTPIVITNREEIRISDSGDALEAAGGAKSKISSVVFVQNDQITPVGGAINLTADGSFVTAGAVFFVDSGDYYVVLNDGRSAKIQARVVDSATGLVFFKAALSNAPVAALGNSEDLKVGEKILFLASSPQGSITKLLLSFVSSAQNDVQKQVFSADRPGRSFGAQAVSPLVPGQAVVSTKAEVVGLWDGTSVVSADVLRQAAGLYFNNAGKIVRPFFGFSYQIITKTESTLLSKPGGGLVKSIVKPSPAAQSGLVEGDIILFVDNDKVSEENLLEEILQKYKPGDSVKLNVVRGTQDINLTIIVSELK